jgi:hypothetical protein
MMVMMAPPISNRQYKRLNYLESRNNCCSERYLIVLASGVFKSLFNRAKINIMTWVYFRPQLSMYHAPINNIYIENTH